MQKVLIKKTGRHKKGHDFYDRIDRTALTMDNLIDTLHKAKEQEANFFAVQIKMPDCNSPETIINSIDNVDTKINYYKNVYNNDLKLKSCDAIQIVNFTFGKTWTEIKIECL